MFRSLPSLLSRNSSVYFRNNQQPTFAAICNNFVRSLTSESNTDEVAPDKLYKKLEIEVRSADNAVLRSYEIFATFAANELGIEHVKTWEPFRYIKRRTLLRDVFVKKKYRVQYEWRTYYRVMEFKNLTGSTLDTYLEYIQRNLPPGVGMKVSKTEIEPLPSHLVPPPETIESTQSAEVK